MKHCESSGGIPLKSQRLRQLRLARGLSLDALAREMGEIVTKQALSKYEQGKAKPSPEVLPKLAKALGVTPDQLLRETSVAIRFIAYRKGSSLTKREQSRVESTVREALEKRVELADITGYHTADVPLQEFGIHKLEDADKMADNLRELWDIGHGPIANVALLLEDHLVHVIEVEASSKFDGLSAVAYRDNQELAATATITRTGLPGERQRFNLAHELGHQVLKVPTKIDEELAAFRFAGALLVPADVLRREIGERRTMLRADELLLMKRRFGISIQALLFRLRDLAIINESHYRHWCREIGRLGWRKTEPQALPTEQPQWLRRVVLRAVAEKSISREEAVEKFGVAIDV